MAAIERVCVIGAGVIGSLFAGHLAEVAEVSVLTRRQDHADALNRDGLRVSGRSERQATIFATPDPDELPAFDLGIVATKAEGLEDAAASLEGRFPDATLMTTLNGLGAEEVVRAHGDWPLVSAVTFMSGTKHSDTEVEYILDTATWMGPYEETPYERVEEIGELVRSLRPEGRDVPRPSPGPLVEADLQRDRERGRRAHRSAARRALTRARRHPPTSVISSTTSSTRARRWRRRQASSSTRTRGR